MGFKSKWLEEFSAKTGIRDCKVDSTVKDTEHPLAGSYSIGVDLAIGPDKTAFRFTTAPKTEEKSDPLTLEKLEEAVDRLHGGFINEYRKSVYPWDFESIRKQKSEDYVDAEWSYVDEEEPLKALPAHEEDNEQDIRPAPRDN
jgi:hypothetical protein